MRARLRTPLFWLAEPHAPECDKCQERRSDGHSLFRVPITLLEEADAVFTDASANTACPPNFFDDPADLAELNWDAIDSLRWSERDEATRHQRMAELLVYNQLPLVDASRCVVWNEDAKKRVQEIVGDAAFPKIAFESPDRRHWYTGFQEKSKSSVVKGPREIAMIFEAACDAIAKERGKHIATATFANLKALRSGLKADFGCLSHTSELVGLASANGMHKHTVDVHTKEVVDKLLSLEEFEALDEREQRLVEIAAFLHDIGKGPRTRWDANGGVQKVDPNHPVGAMPMMVDILTNKVGTLTQSSAEVLAKLVCYHDLVGDVLGRGRDEQQIIDIVASKSELDMLFALGRADIEALSETWWDDDDAESLYGRCLAAVEKKNNT
ncbi:MAG: DUF4433 domain-containing protein [Mesorhizobium sp.]|nr:MAG: DUF4433 domain-containing protein [Mesorhizobium sp.]